MADYTRFVVSNNTITLDANALMEILDEEGNVVEVIPSVTVKTLVISRPYYPTNIASDKGVTIKSVQAPLVEYTYTYVDPKVESVQVTFVATNTLYGEIIQEIKEMEIVFSD